MTDRNVQYPQRYQLQKVEGTDDIYDLIPTPGTITDEGTIINKSALLKDETAALFSGLPENPVPDDVFSILSKAAVFADGELKLPNGEQISQAEILYGSYRGTGSGTQVTLTFPFPPDLVIIIAENMSIYYGGIFIKGGSNTMLLLTSIDLPYYFSEKNLVLNREMGDPSMALNSPVNYYYVAIKSK